jgi:hypothetical protein
MPRLFHVTYFRHCAAWLLAAGLFAMTMHAFAGVGLVRANSASGGFHAELCTGKGLNATGPSAPSGGSSQPDGDPHDCCTLCAAGAALLTIEAVPGVLPAPSLEWFSPASALLHPAAPARLANPPRGPPLA